MVSISVSEAAALHVGRKMQRRAGVLVYRDVLKNGEFIPKAMIGTDPGDSLFILADNRTVPVWVEKEFFDQLEEGCSVSISMDRGFVKRLKLDIEQNAVERVGQQQNHGHYLSA
jgi:hypothetical protein